MKTIYMYQRVGIQILSAGFLVGIIFLAGCVHVDCAGGCCPGSGQPCDEATGKNCGPGGCDVTTITAANRGSSTCNIGSQICTYDGVQKCGPLNSKTCRTNHPTSNACTCGCP